MNNLIHPLLIIFISITSVILITTGWMKRDYETRLEHIGITRTWYIPVFAVSILYLTSSVDQSIILSVLIDKIDIILLVLCFSLLSEGLSRSDVFDYAGAWMCRNAENKTQFVLQIFVVTSVVTLFTSNDIVIIALTPIIIKLAVSSGLKNLKIVLLSQFVVANTLSMATYIGSPTNIIISQEIGMNFIQYSIYMLIPSIISFFTSLAILFAFIKASEKISWMSNYKMNPDFTIQEPDDRNLDQESYIWITLFVLSVITVAFLTLYGMSLLWCAIPTLLLSTFILYNGQSSLTSNFSELPYGIFFFGISFFVIGESIVSSRLVSSNVTPALNSFFSNNPNLSWIASFLSSGLLVNIFNDLPASAIIAPILDNIDFVSEAHRIVTIQSVLIGLNIGKYLTQVGSLAGIIWFTQIDNASSRDLELPSKSDLLFFGLVNFVITGAVLSLYLLLEYRILSSYLT